MAVCKALCLTLLVAFLAKGCYSQLNVCGQAPLNSKIVGGQDAPVGGWPWQASLQQLSGFHFCGGSLINNQYVLTAAHCFPSTSTSNLQVILGAKSLDQTNPNQVSSSVAQIICNPNYDKSTSDNDMCLLQLSSPVTFTNYIQPVCLAAPGSTYNAGIVSWVTGWGTINSGVNLPSPRNLQEVDVPIVGNRQCNCNYGVGSITDNMLCAGLKAGGKDSCQGDSGGPMVSKQGGRWIQSGVVSFGKGCALANFPGVYARVSKYQTWINSIITSSQPGFVTFNSSGTDSDLSITCTGLPPVPTTVSPTPKPAVCGSASLNSRIGGGSVASAGTWPWMASIHLNGTHVCGGTLVAENFVMSDAGCFSSQPKASGWMVVLGSLKQNGTNPFEVTLNVTNITMSNLTGNNVALLQLGTKPTLSNYIQPICLDTSNTNVTLGSTCWVAGWGAGQGMSLQELQTSVVDCGNASTADSICTGAVTLQKGDEGGPLMCKQNNAWFQAAVLTLTSISNSSTNSSSNSNKTLSDLAQRSSPMVFSKVSRYGTFIRATVGGLLSPASTSSPVAATTVNGASPAQASFSSLLLLSLTGVFFFLK